MQFLMLLVFAIGGIIAGLLLALLICLAVYGKGLLDDTSGLSGEGGSFAGIMKITQIFVSVGLFLVPPVGLALYEGKGLTRFYSFRRPQINLLLMVLLIMVISMPLMEWIALLNQKMVLPDFLRPVELWMKRKEQEAMGMTISLLTMKTIWDFLLNVFMIALLPAVAEELMFRGGVQRTFTRMFGNPHAAIWISAAIFSAIHMQFYGFIPRLLLGAGFGYIYLWSGNLWYAMLAHFLNNVYAVCVVWYLQLHKQPWSEIDNTPHFAWYGYLMSFILTIFAFQFFKKQTK